MHDYTVTIKHKDKQIASDYAVLHVQADNAETAEDHAALLTLDPSANRADYTVTAERRPETK